MAKRTFLGGAVAREWHKLETVRADLRIYYREPTADVGTVRRVTHRVFGLFGLARVASLL